MNAASPPAQIPNEPLARAQHEQRRAADPAASVFVSAHAGTGKTKLLIDRVLRLMLTGAEPGRILCLTFTRAAAAEMAVRLGQRLGEWVMLDDAALDERLRDIGHPPTAASRDRARSLFGRVLDQPGGMRIETIHAFCQSLLRRFPLEARVSPHFALAAEEEMRATLAEAREAALAAADPAVIARIAGFVRADEFAGLVQTLHGQRDRLAGVLGLDPAAREAVLLRAVGLPHADAEAWERDIATVPNEAALRAELEYCFGHSGASDAARKLLSPALGWLKLNTAALRLEHLGLWRNALLTQSGTRRAGSALACAAVRRGNDTLGERIAAEQLRLQHLLAHAATARIVRATTQLLTLAAPALARTEAEKNRACALDYDDLIGRSRALLHDPGIAWVMHKLDGGLDHLLLDEVQDNSASQWEVADALTAEFFAGDGARPSTRTLFAVGDRKQSIFAFQGADPAGFDRQLRTTADRARDAGRPFQTPTLDVSFRSTAPILALTDAVFAETAGAAAGIAGEGLLRHLCRREGEAGSVELWPLAPRAATDTPDPWSAGAGTAVASATQRLVARIADWIAEALATGAMLESQGRPIRAGDILVLVRTRTEIDSGLVRELKSRGVPVAGLDRMALTQQIAVADLLGLCRVLLLPQDDLALAELLTSPLGGLSDDSLMALAMARAEPRLWDTLRARAGERADWGAALDLLTDLLARVDYDDPHALLCHVLGRRGGRARLLARLGPEAAEPIDELLGLALDYAQAHPPSLGGFLRWLDLSGAMIKRVPEAAGNAVRLMTVHGAKGLEAPIVILPDTTGVPVLRDTLFWAPAAGGTAVPLWVPRSDMDCPVTADLREAGKRHGAEEANRLLYVALTRPRDRLIVCGRETGRAGGIRGTWYEAILHGFGRLAATATPFGYWDGARLLLHTPQTAALPAARAPAAIATPPPPGFLGAAPFWRAAPPPEEPALPDPLAPSRPDGAGLGQVPASRSPLIRAGETPIGRGLLAHTLLEHLPGLAPDRRRAAARRFIERASPRPDGADRLIEQVLAVLNTPALAPLFGPASRAEQRLTGLVAGRVVSGQVDRLAVLPDRVLVADYKTGRHPPATPESAPLLYVRQMAAYRAVLHALFPDRPVVCLLVWTETCTVMELPSAVLDAAVLPERLP